MKEKSLSIIKIFFAFALSFILLFTTLYSYRNSFEYLYELTFLSNFLSGLFLLIVCIFWFFNKQIPQFLFLDFTMLLLIVFGVCMAFVTDFNFEGGFLYLHIVNPILMLAFYMVFSNQRKTKWQFIFTVLLLPLIYLIFALIYGTSTDNYIYFFLDYNAYGIAYSILFIFSILVGLIVMSIILYGINKLMHRHIFKCFK